MTIGLITLIALAILIEVWWVIAGLSKSGESSFKEIIWMWIAGINIILTLWLIGWGIYKLATMPFWKIEIL